MEYALNRLALYSGVVWLTLLCMAPESQAIRCFQCTSQFHPECHDLKKEDNETSIHYKECHPDPQMGAPPGTKMFCRKIVQKIIDRDNLVRTVRKCGWIMNSKKKDCYEYKNEGHEDIVCQCFEDACNSALRATHSINAFLLGATTTILLSIKAINY